MIATIVSASQGEHACLVHDLAAVLKPYLRRTARCNDGVIVHQAAVTASATCPHRACHAAALDALGAVHHRLGGYDLAQDLHRQALRLHLDLDDPAAHAATLNRLALAERASGRIHQALRHQQQAITLLDPENPAHQLALVHSLGNLGITYDLLGKLDEALECYHRVLILCTSLGDPLNEARTLDNIGIILRRRGDVDDAMAYHRRARRIYRRHPDTTAYANCVENLGSAYLAARRPDTALTLLTWALRARKASGEIAEQANTHHDLGLTHLARHEPDQAADHLHQALALATKHGHRTARCRVLNAQAELALYRDDADTALKLHRQALILAEDLMDLDEQARAHTGIAHAATRTGTHPTAGDHYHQAVALRTRLGMPLPPAPWEL